MISRRDVKYVIAFALVSSIITSAAALAMLYPFGSRPYVAMAILGPSELAENYFPGENSTVRLGEQVNWTLNVYNDMGTLEYVVVRVKILNSSLPGPNDTLGTPSPVQSILEFRHILVSNETWSTNFVWQIENITREGDSLLLSSLLLNGVRNSGSLAAAKGGHNFRFVFELWFYDTSTNQLEFFYRSQNTQYVVWDEIWFNVVGS